MHRAPDPRHFRYASKKYWEPIAKDLRPIYHRASADAAWAAFEEFEEKWGKAYPAIPRLWRAAWEQFIPFLAYDVEIRKVLCSTNAIESLNARYRRAVNAKGHFPTEQAALKTLYLVTAEPGPQGPGAGTMGHPVEASPERLRDHLCRPHARGGEPVTHRPVPPGTGQTRSQVTGVAKADLDTVSRFNDR